MATRWCCYPGNSCYLGFEVYPSWFFTSAAFSSQLTKQGFPYLHIFGMVRCGTYFWETHPCCLFAKNINCIYTILWCQRNFTKNDKDCMIRMAVPWLATKTIILCQLSATEFHIWIPLSWHKIKKILLYLNWTWIKLSHALGFGFYTSDGDISQETCAYSLLAVHLKHGWL